MTQIQLTSDHVLKILRLKNFTPCLLEIFLWPRFSVSDIVVLFVTSSATQYVHLVLVVVKCLERLTGVPFHSRLVTNLASNIDVFNL